jgi:hypothetical protein
MTTKDRKRSRRAVPALLTLAALAVVLAVAAAEEGMWPASELGRLGLNAKGLEIAVEDIYKPGGIGLVHAVVQVGATGSFVSPEGLILTNHHVAFGAAQAASTTARDYVRDGFLARTRAEEIEAKGMTARITESFHDVSADVLGAVKPSMAPEARTQAVQRKIKEIVARAEKANPGKRAEVSEMFAGKAYVLFLFSYLKDIRLVYVPPRSIGEFGGEVDNWMWPRHTGDFSFLRAYAAPDGSPADFSPANVPYRPKKFLKVAPEGAAEGDFVFLLGYPGRTYRHRTSHYLAYEQDLRMPDIADWYEWQIGLMEKMGEGDRAVALKHSARIKGLANTMKNYRGKLQGMARVGIVDAKRREEKALQAWIDADPVRQKRAGDLLARFASIYDEMRESHDLGQVLSYLRSHVNLLSWAATVYEASIERAKKDLEREPAYMDRNFDQTRRRLALGLANYHQPTDKAVLEALILRAIKSPEIRRIAPFAEVAAAGDPARAAKELVERLYSGTRMGDPGFVKEAWTKSRQELEALGDPVLELAAALHPLRKEMQARSEAWTGRLDPMYAELQDLKAGFLGRDFVPDANSTLRMTFGRIKGYSPRDAVYYSPVTTLDGVLEKTTGRPPFDTPAKLFDLRRAEDFGPYRPEGLPSVPACILYDADTTGGNSGSPVLNARGELVAVNFDRTYEATINDYAWNADYSRSIGVDIRYVLWVTQKFAGAEFLLEEMGVKAK